MKKTLVVLFLVILLFGTVSAFNFEGDGIKIISPLESNGAIPVNIQDQTSPLIIAYMSKEHASTFLASNTSIDDISFDLVNVTGWIAGDYISLFNIESNRFFLASVLNVSGNTITIDSPLDYGFPAGSYATAGNRNMNVDGSITPIIYGLRNTEEAIGTSFDITRIIITCLGENSIDLSKFCDIPGGLNNGIVFRKVDGTYQNLFNAKSNWELKNLMYDLEITSTTNPAQGQNGMVGRLTFGGQEKMGAVIRLDPGEDIQLIIQDDLTSIERLSIIAEGHVVTN